MISTTLSEMETKESSMKQPETSQQDRSGPEVVEGEDVDDLLSKLKAAAPKVVENQSEASGLGSFDKLLDDLLSPEAVLDSMEDLANEMESFLSDKSPAFPEYARYVKQAEIYRAVSTAYRSNPKVLEMDNPDSESIKKKLDELQTLGSPPPEVLEKLMKSEFSNDDGQKTDLGKEFEQFLKGATSGGLIPGLTAEDEQIINELTRDPNALKNLLGDVTSGDKNGDCCLM